MENAEVGISINARYRVILNLSEPRRERIRRQSKLKGRQVDLQPQNRVF
jgi:hypothetical protein